MWPDVLEVVKRNRRFTWTLLTGNAQVAALDGKVLTLAMVNAGARDSFAGSGSDELVRQALIDVLGVDWKVEAIVDPSKGASGATTIPAAPVRPVATAGGSSSAAPSMGVSAAAGAESASPPAAAVAPEDDVPAEDDPDMEDSGLSGAELLVRELGAKVIGEFDNQ
jgi:DNA polymerase-3 subunit gamma/tau